MDDKERLQKLHDLSTSILEFAEEFAEERLGGLASDKHDLTLGLNPDAKPIALLTLSAGQTMIFELVDVVRGVVERKQSGSLDAAAVRALARGLRALGDMLDEEARA